MSPALVTGKVKYQAGNPREGKFGPYVNVLVVLDGGEEVRVYDNPDGPVADLAKGQAVQLLQDQKNGKFVYKLLQTANQIATQPATQHQNGSQSDGKPTPEELEEKFEKLLRLNAKRYGKALKIAKHIVKNELGVELNSPLQEDQQVLLEPLKCIASSLFIEACRGMR